MQQDPNSVAHYNLGTVYANEETQAGYSLAVKKYQEVLRLNPNGSAARLSLAKALLSLQRYDEAVTCLKDYIRQEPRRYVGYYDLGSAYREEGN